MEQLKKNNIMTYLTLSTVLLSIIVHVLHRQFDLFHSYTSAKETGASASPFLLNVLLILPLITLAITAFIKFMKEDQHKHVPFWNTITLTFTSISIIAGGDGMVEYHFSIFMVIAMLAYYESVKLILISTTIFAVHHLIGYFTIPELICGTNQYPFGVLLLHAVFLILTSVSTTLQIMNKQKYVQAVEAEQAEKKDELESILLKLQSTSKVVIDTTETLMGNTTKSRHSSQEISKVIQEIASGAEEQAHSTNESSTAILEMTTGIQQIASSSTAVVERSQSTVNEGRKGIASVGQTTEQMNAIHQSMNSLAQTIENLDNKSEKIGTILRVITEITEQTNLLALNAAIEAARAGEHGRGFAIVAEEVRKLAEQSKTSASEIKTITEEIKTGTKEATQAMLQGKTEIDNGLLNIQQTDEVLKSILIYAEEVAHQIQDISAVSDQLSSSSEEVSASVEEMARIAQAASDNTKHVVTFTEEQLSSIEEIQNVAQSLQDMSLELEELVKQFKNED